MKFSTKAEYGLRAVLYLAKDSKPVSLSWIAQKEGLSLPYLERIFSKLKNAGLVQSFKGSKGGYNLSRSATQISVAQVITALEGSVYQLKCRGCQHPDCRVNYVWEKLEKQISKTLSQIKLSKLL